MSDLSQDLQRDKKAFLHRVNDFTNGDRPPLYRKVIDDLID